MHLRKLDLLDFDRRAREGPDPPAGDRFAAVLRLNTAANLMAWP
jgi:hypothetical protein